MKREYTFDVLLKIFILSRERALSDSDRIFCQEILNGLERLFQIRLSNGSHKDRIKSDLHSELFSLVNFINKIEVHSVRFFARITCEENKEFTPILEEIATLNRNILGLKTSYESVIYDLLNAMYGEKLINQKRMLTFTSDDLKNLGVDDKHKLVAHVFGQIAASAHLH